MTPIYQPSRYRCSETFATMKKPTLYKHGLTNYVIVSPLSDKLFILPKLRVAILRFFDTIKRRMMKIMAKYIDADKLPNTHI